MNKLNDNEYAIVDITYMNWEKGLAVFLRDFGRSNFAVKRIPRKYEDYRRIYARSYLGYGKDVARKLHCGRERCPYILLLGYEIVIRVKAKIGKSLRRVLCR